MCLNPQTWDLKPYLCLLLPLLVPHGLHGSAHRGFNTIYTLMCVFSVVHVHVSFPRVDMLFCLLLLVDKWPHIKKSIVKSQCIHRVSTIYDPCHMWETQHALQQVFHFHFCLVGVVSTLKWWPGCTQSSSYTLPKSPLNKGALHLSRVVIAPTMLWMFDVGCIKA